MYLHVTDWPSIVVFEPDQASLKALCDRLTSDRYEVHPAPTTAEALRLLRQAKPDLILLNVSSDSPGIKVLRQIRQADAIADHLDPQLPIIGLGGNSAAERITVLEEGADDIVWAPVSYEELRARICALLRRTKDQAPSPIAVGELLVDPSRHKVFVGRREVGLTRTEFALLEKLASEPTRVFSYAELSKAVWSQAASDPGTRTIHTHASRLRRKLDPDHGTYVVSTWGVGCSLLSVGGEVR